MKRKPRFSEERYDRRHHRAIRCVILEMHARTLAFRAYLADYQRWTETEEFRKEDQHLKALMVRVNEILDKEAREAPIQPQNQP